MTEIVRPAVLDRVGAAITSRLPAPIAGKLGWIAAAVTLLALVAVHVFAARGAELPVFWEDEAGYLGNAQVLAGVGQVPDLRGRPYYLGWSLLLVPLWWVFQDGQAVYLGSVVLSALCGIAVVVPLTLIARRMGVTWPWAVAIGAIVALAPARSLQSGFGLPENLLALLVAWAALFAMRYAARESLGNALALALLSGAAFATHGRVVPIVAATGLWLLLGIRRHPGVTLAALAALGVVSGGSFLLYRHVTGLIYGDDGARESVGIGRILNADPLGTTMAGVGQIWYVVVAWLGLSVIGAVVVARRIPAEWRSRAGGPALWGAVVLLGIAVVSFPAISSAIARGSTRLDILSYGRYLDPAIVPIVVIGFAALVLGISRRLAIGTLLATVAVAALWFAVVWPNRNYEGTLWWAPINVAGVLQYGFHYNPRFSWAPWLPASLFAVVAVGVLVLLRRRVVLLAALLLLFFTASTVYAEARVMRPFFAPWNAGFTLRETLTDDPILGGQPVSFDMDQVAERGDIASKNAYQILLAPAPVTIFDSGEGGHPDTELVIARHDWVLAGELGAVAVEVDQGLFDNTLWVLPGPLLDRLDDAGVLDTSSSEH